MLRDFLFKKMIEKKIAGLTDEQKSELLEMLKSHPDFFEQIISEIHEETARGTEQQEAVRRVVIRNQSRIMDIFKEGGFVK